MSEELLVSQSCYLVQTLKVLGRFALVVCDLRVNMIPHFIPLINLNFYIVLVSKMFSPFQVALGFLCSNLWLGKKIRAQISQRLYCPMFHEGDPVFMRKSCPI